jgi:hypothetical protein
MSDFYSHHDSYIHKPGDLNDSLGQHEYSPGEQHGHDTDYQPHDYNLFPDGHWITGNESVLQHPDPLSVSIKFTMAPLKLHMVKPHVVNGYTREDGTVVKLYIRDGNGDGYLRSNPDGIESNNLGYLLGDK